jgi:hypothetical protein
VCDSGYSKALDPNDISGFICRAIPPHSHINENGALVCDDNYIRNSTGGCVLKPTTCPLGYTLPNGDWECRPCAIDTYKDNTGLGACTSCQNGMYHSPAASTSASACQITTTCGPGQQLKLDVINQSAGCDACPVDTYKTTTDQSMCTPCPTGQTTYGQIGQTSCQTKSTWFQGTLCASSAKFNVNNYRTKDAYCNDYDENERGNNDPCCNSSTEQTTPTTVTQTASSHVSSCNCDLPADWDESACGDTWVAVCRPDRDGGR